MIVGLPKARMAMDGWTLEVTRLASDGTRNVCSLLYGAARRAALALGYKRVITYTLAEEEGASLRASGFVLEAEIEGESWERRHKSDGRFVDNRNPIGDKKRWGFGAKCSAELPTFVLPARELPLFADAVDPSEDSNTGKPPTRD